MVKRTRRTVSILCLSVFFAASFAVASEEKKEDKAHAEAPKDGAPPAEGAEADVPSAPATPLPRFIKAPRAMYIDTEAGDKEVTVDYKRSTFTVVGVLATWNTRSAEIALVLNKHFDILKPKNISIVTLFSHDTKLTLKEWKKVNKPKFKTGVTSINFIDEQKNPKVPSFWVVDNKGHLVKFLETPVNADLETILVQLAAWTDF